MTANGDANTSDLIFAGALGWALDRTGDLSGRTVLDVGCGEGRASVSYAQRGATVIGIDNDGAALAQAVALAAESRVADRCHFMLGAAENLPLIASSTDLIFSKSTAQYLRRDEAFSEYLRTLKPDGRMLLIENLPWNPFVNLYRGLRSARSKLRGDTSYVETILGHVKPSELTELGRNFETVERRHFHLLRVLTMFKARTSGERSLASRIDRGLHRFDTAALGALPVLGRAAWIVAVYMDRASNPRSTVEHSGESSCNHSGERSSERTETATVS